MVGLILQYAIEALWVYIYAQVSEQLIMKVDCLNPITKWAT